MPMRTNPSTARETQGGPASYMSRTSIPSRASPSSSSSCSRLLLCLRPLSLSLSRACVCVAFIERREKNKLSEEGNKDGQKNKKQQTRLPKGKISKSIIQRVKQAAQCSWLKHKSIFSCLVLAPSFHPGEFFHCFTGWAGLPNFRSYFSPPFFFLFNFFLFSLSLFFLFLCF